MENTFKVRVLESNNVKVAKRFKDLTWDEQINAIGGKIEYLVEWNGEEIMLLPSHDGGVHRYMWNNEVELL